MPAFLERELVTAAFCWRLERLDGVALGFTTHDRDLVRGGLRYRAAPGMLPSAISVSDGFEAASLDIKGALTSAAISSADLAAGRWDGASVHVFMVDWEAPEGEALAVARGELGEVSIRADAFEAELRGDALLLPFIRAADLILCAGYDPIEMRSGWREVWDPAAVHVIDIAAVPNRHYVHQAGINVVAHTGKTLALIGEGVAGQATWAGGAVEALKAALADAFPRDEDWGPAAVIDTCRRVLPKETVATCDTGAHRILFAQMWAAHEPRTVLQSTGLCTMGCALPLAIGAQLAEPERPVVAFTGDGGLLMVAGELSTAAELGSRVIAVVFVDASLALIELKQRQRQMANAGVDFARHDFAAIGRAFGGIGHTVTSRAELEAALDDALNAETFTVIAAVIERGSYDGRI